MGSTTFHIPDDLLSEIDRAAARRDISRNRFVLDACRAALSREAGSWPEDFFTNAMSADDTELLKEAALDMERAIAANRRNRGAALL